MTKYILHGGCTREDNDLNKKFRQEVTKSVPEGAVVLMVLFAQIESDIPSRFESATSQLIECAMGKRVEFILATTHNFEKQIKEADVIYLDGGNTSQLIEVVREHSDFAQLVQGKTVVGSSAGAYLLSTHYHSASLNKVGQGLGLLPIRVICHYESEKFDYDRGDPVGMMAEIDNNLELVILRDFEMKVIEQ